MLSNNLAEEQGFCGYITDEKKRSCALANIIALKSAFEFFKSCGLNPGVEYAAHRIKKVFEDIDISDLYIGDLRLDVRLGMMKGEYLVPCSHYELNITPDLYMFVDYDKETGKTEVAGFIEPDKIDKSVHDDYYYFISKTSIVSIDTLETLFDSLPVKAKAGLPLNCKKKSILYLDNQLLDVKEFYQDLMNYEKARKMLMEYADAEIILCDANLSFEKSIDAAPVKAETITSEELELGFADGLAEPAVTDVDVLDSFIAGEDSDLKDTLPQNPTETEKNVLDELSDMEIVEESPAEPEKPFNEEGIALDLSEENFEEPATAEPEVQPADFYTVDLPGDMEENIAPVENVEENEVLELDLPSGESVTEVSLEEEKIAEPEQELTSDEEVLDLSPVDETETPAAGIEPEDDIALSEPTPEDSIEEPAIALEDEAAEDVSLQEEEILETPETLMPAADLPADEIEEPVMELEDEVAEDVSLQEEEILETPETLTPAADLPADDVEDLPLEEEISLQDSLDAAPVVEELEVPSDIDDLQEQSLPEEDIDMQTEELSAPESELMPEEEELTLEEEPVETTVEEPELSLNEQDAETLEPVVETEIGLEEENLPDLENESDFALENSNEDAEELTLETQELAFETGDLSMDTQEPVYLEEDDTSATLELSDDIESPLDNEAADTILSEETPVLEDNEPGFSSEELPEIGLEEHSEELVLDEPEELEETADTHGVNEAQNAGLSFSEFAEDIQNIDNKADKEESGVEAEKDYDPNYVPDFASGEFRLADDGTSFNTPATEKVVQSAQELDNELEKELETAADEPAGIDIQAAMEGFVNTMAPDEAIALVQPSEEPAGTGDEELAAISTDEEIVQEDVPPAESQEEPDTKEEINELYTDDTEEPVIEQSYKKKKKSSAGLLGGIFVLIVALGVFGFMNKDVILSKIQGGEQTESLPNELATKPVETQPAPQPKKDELETEAEAMLDDIEEPVQLLDTSVSVSSMTVDCDVPSYMVNTHSRRYLIKLAKRMQLQLRNALLIASEQPLANKIVIDLSVDKDVLKYEKISSSSGSKKVDEITAATTGSVLKSTQPYAGTFGKNKGIIRLIVKF